MYCPNCKKEYDGRFCPECGRPLIELPDCQGNFNLNLGDANAISGGIHLADSHNIHNEDKSVHNITNNTSTITNITQVSAQKTELELLQEHKVLFLNACKRAYEDNVLEPSEAIELEELRIKIGLDRATADGILKSVKELSDRNTRKSDLNQIAKTKLRILTDNLQKNDVTALMNQIDSLEPLVRRFDHDELSRKYYLVLAALNPQKCIEEKERTQTDSYWETFWCYLAYIKAGCLGEAEDTLANLDHFSRYPEDNMTILAAAGALMMGHTEEAKEYLDATTGEYTPALQRFVDSLNLLLTPAMAKETGADENHCAFYLINFFGQKNPRAKAEEEALAILAERKQKVVVQRKWLMAIGDAISFDEVEEYWSNLKQPIFSRMRVEEPTNKSISKFCTSIGNNDNSLVLFHPQKKELLGYSKRRSVGVLYYVSHDMNKYFSKYAVIAEARQALKDYFSLGNRPKDLESWQNTSFEDLLSK